MGKNIRNGSVAIGDTEMYYVSFGSGARTLTVIPGLSDGLATVKGKGWLLATPYKQFLNEFTVYMFSRKNSMPEGYTIRQMAEDQVTALHELGVDKTCVLGVSQGGMISQYIAIDHPEIVDRLVLAVTAPNANDTARSAVTSWIGMAERGDHVALMVDTAEKSYSQSYLDKNRRTFPLIARFTKPADYERFLRNANAILGFDARDELYKIKAPTLIIAGEDDKTVGNDAPYELNCGIAGSELYIYKGLGHASYEEGKDFYARVLEFCTK
ncbi:Pimeloyl-ACP methyl ester carboxylesterase [Ruminococcaceae bacterium YRB3002]|nr:Pimeloyl-ACP methyl ester carboxylesterase [Ruminococcaceae bacterium YRB3002]